MWRAGVLCLAVCSLATATQVVTRPDEAATAKPKKILDSSMSTQHVPHSEFSAHYWKRNAYNTLREKLETPINIKKAKNGIFFIGDGMSLATVMAARTYAGQLSGRAGEETRLAFERFPVSGLAKTYCIDAQVADSACTATAYLTGVKTKYGTIGINGNVTRSDCSTQLHRPNWVHSIATWALEHGLDTGLVTTTRVTHASPAGTFAHAAERDWESDADLSPEARALGCKDIAAQLVEDRPGNLFKVIMGGGRQEFTRNLSSLGEASTGKRLDGKDLTEVWKTDKRSRNASHEYVTDRDGLMKINDMSPEDMPEFLLGLFHDDHMEYHLKSPASQPTLQQMTEVAIKMLSRNPKGYFLFVEGGRIDHAHHKNLAQIAMDETVEYSRAIHKANSMTSDQDTLIVVSSDHAHTMTVSGYPSRGNDILGVVDTAVGSDNKPYTTLSYANGIGYKTGADGLRLDVTSQQLFNDRDINYKYPGAIPLDDETHGGEDVAVWARGPWQHLFTATYEQNVIPHLMAFAMCIAEDKHDACHTRAGVQINASSALVPSVLLLISVIFACLR